MDSGIEIRWREKEYCAPGSGLSKGFGKMGYLLKKRRALLCNDEQC